MTPVDSSDYKTLFISTANEHIMAMEKQLQNLKNGGDEATIGEELFRHAHSLKGSSSIMNQQEIAKLCDQIDEIIHPDANLFYLDITHINKVEDNLQKIKQLLSQVSKL